MNVRIQENGTVDGKGWSAYYGVSVCVCLCLCQCVYVCICVYIHCTLEQLCRDDYKFARTQVVMCDTP